AIGVDVSGITPGGRRLVVAGGEIEFVLARPSDIATYVERGAADLGIVGKDVLLETGAKVIELAELGFGACRFVVAGARGAVGRSRRSWSGSRRGRPRDEDRPALRLSRGCRSRPRRRRVRDGRAGSGRGHHRRRASPWRCRRAADRPAIRPRTRAGERPGGRT